MNMPHLRSAVPAAIMHTGHSNSKKYPDMSDPVAQPEKEYSDEEVTRPAFRLELSHEQHIPCRHLFMQVFEQTNYGARTWRSLPTDEWHLLASIFADRIVTYPIFTNPHAQRYLKPKHGCFHTLVYEDDGDESLPDNAEDAMEEIDRRQAWRIFRDNCQFGLGLDKALEPVWRGLASLGSVDTLICQSASKTFHLSASNTFHF